MLPWFFVVIQIFTVACAVLVIGEALIIFRRGSAISIKRNLADKLSLGDVQRVQYDLRNPSKHDFDVEWIDELPVQLQQRMGPKKLRINGGENTGVEQNIKPNSRGNYHFGNMHVFVSFLFPGLVQYRYTFEGGAVIRVMPSFIQMKKYSLSVFSKTAHLRGIRRVRVIGENDEYEYTRRYMTGDNIKSINWKATSRTGRLMSDQFQDTRSQNIYFLVDKGRVMKMPFHGLTLLDYAINSTLVLANIVLMKYDRAGLITFSSQMDSMLKAEALQGQLTHISELLYGQKTNFGESDYRLLHQTIRRRIKRRSILMLFTNFESEYDLQRQLTYLINLSKSHLLVVISFINTEIEETLKSKDEEVNGIYYKTFARRQLQQKERIMDELKSHGIQTILTAPENLSVNVINKYLEIKARRMR